MMRWKPARWFHDSFKSGHEAGIEAGDRMPPINAIEDESGRSVASSHDLFEFDGDKAFLMAAAPDLRDLAAEMAAALRAQGGNAALADRADALLREIANGDVEGKAHDGLNAVHAVMPRHSELSWEILPAERRIHLHMMSIPSSARGQGDHFLKLACAVADSLGLALTLVADPTEREGDPDGPALAAWYGRNGFAVTGDDESTGSPAMRREPGGKAGPAA